MFVGKDVVVAVVEIKALFVNLVYEVVVVVSVVLFDVDSCCVVLEAPKLTLTSGLMTFGNITICDKTESGMTSPPDLWTLCLGAPLR